MDVRNGTADDGRTASRAHTDGDGTGHGPRCSVLRTASVALRGHGRRLFGLAARAAGLAALGGLLVTALGFLVAWPAFTEMRRGAIAARRMEDSYAPSGLLVQDLWLIALAGLPFLVLLLHLGCAAVQTAASRAVADREDGHRPEVARGRAGSPATDVSAHPADGRERGRFGAVLGSYLLRAAGVWAPLVTGILVSEYFTTTLFREYTALVPKWEYPTRFALLHDGAPLLGLAITLVLRLGWALAPAAATAEHLGPLRSLRRSWSLVWGGATAWLRTLAAALPLGALTVGAYLLLHAAARPLRPGASALFLAWGTGNTYTAYCVGILAPIAAALLLTGVLTLPPAHVVLAALRDRLARERERRARSAAATGADRA
ncbi:hypothetical protein [Streptomyces qinglanensis]|uniref:hypothetical protein n=1 Tax=Streptomyces qinglanensis TaxID=943816 RepID=UPI003D70CD5B